MTFSKYYLKQPKQKIVQDISLLLLVGGALVLSGASPSLATGLWKNLGKKKKYRKKSVENAFSRLKKQGCLEIQKSGHQVSIALTKEGRIKAGKFQINHLEIQRPKKWDRKWRVVIFDIIENGPGRTKRNGLRGFLFRLGFWRLQHSVWIHPFDCTQELALLREFFGLTTKEVRLLVVEAFEGEGALKEIFGL